MRFRLYIDEVGVSDLASATTNPNERFLSLTGVITTLDFHSDRIQPEIDALKAKFFGHSEHSKIILHRREILRKEGAFSVLKNEDVKNEFDKELLKLIEDLPYRVITVAMDKKEHFDKYGVWHFDPYHYCLRCMIERYVLYLNQNMAFIGDVMIETRYKDADKKLKASYQKIYESGTEHLPAHIVQKKLTTKEIKFSAKKENVAGIQLCDLLAHPSFRAMRNARDGISPPDDYGSKIVSILDEKKYRRCPKTFKVLGFGKKWLP